MTLSVPIEPARTRGRPLRATPRSFSLLLPAIAAGVWLATGGTGAAAAEEGGQAARIEKLIPAIEAYIAKGMAAYRMPGLSIGIVAGDRLVYAKGFGVRGEGGEPVDPRTVFQIGSTTKAFLSATMAIMVDRGRLDWRDRVTALYPEFKLKDPQATRKFRFLDLVAQRSGMPTSANDNLGMYGYGEKELIRSLRHVETTSKFRSTFSYTNITHILAGRIVAAAAKAEDWNAVLERELLEPLGMRHSSFTAKGLANEKNRSQAHRWTPDETVPMRLTPLFPYDFTAAGDINSNIEDMAHWIRLQLADGRFEGRRLISKENLAVTHVPRVHLTDALSYAMGWYVFESPGGTYLWHDGDSHGFGSFVGLATTRDVGFVLLTNTQNAGFPTALGHWIMDRILGNPEVDHVQITLDSTIEHFEARQEMFARPGNPEPPPELDALAGEYANSSFGAVTVARQGEALVVTLGSGARLQLDPWNGAVFTARLLPGDGFGPIAKGLGPLPSGFADFLAVGEAGRFVLSAANGQTYRFTRR